MHKGTINLKKVNWSATKEHEFIQNFKILQSGFNKADIEKSIPILELVKAKMADNLKFARWFQEYIRLCEPTLDDYNPSKRRGIII